MASLVWNRDPHEAFDNPYEYPAQEQFHREAASLIERLYRLLAHHHRHRYTRDERTVEKAIWLLHLDALGSLGDALATLRDHRHRSVPHLLRSSEETLDLASVFTTRTKESNALLDDWYQNKVISHRTSRRYLEAHDAPAVTADRQARYTALSRFTHRTYRSIMEGYGAGVDHIFHDGSGMYQDPDSNRAAGLPQTIAAYSAALATHITHLVQTIVQHGTVTKEEANQAHQESMEADPAPRRFFPHGNHPEAFRQAREQLRRGQPLSSISPPVSSPLTIQEIDIDDAAEPPLEGE